MKYLFIALMLCMLGCEGVIYTDEEEPHGYWPTYNWVCSCEDAAFRPGTRTPISISMCDQWRGTRDSYEIADLSERFCEEEGRDECRCSWESCTLYTVYQWECDGYAISPQVR
jgi:hypothetical protein